MSGDFSRDAFARILGPETLALAESEGVAAPPPSQATVERVRKIFAPSLARLAGQRQPSLTDAATVVSRKARAA